MPKQETLEERLKRTGILDVPLSEVITELENLRTIRNQVALLIAAASEEGMKSDMFSEMLDTLEVLLYPSKFKPSSTKRI